MRRLVDELVDGARCPRAKTNPWRASHWQSPSYKVSNEGRILIEIRVWLAGAVQLVRCFGGRVLPDAQLIRLWGNYV